MGTAVVERIEEDLGGFAAGFDPALVTASDAAALVDQMAHIERLAAGVRIAAAGRVAETSLWRAHGDKTPEEWLARKNKSSIFEAAAELGTAKRLADLPGTADAVRAGKLTARQATEISRAAAAAPDAETTLLGVAEREGLRGLKDRCNAVRLAATDTAARDERIRQERFVRTSTDSEGAFNLSMRGPAADGARLLAALQPFQAGQFEQARTAGDRPPFEATAFDAMVAMATATIGGSGSADAPRKGGEGVKVIVRIDHAALRRGHATSDETCEIAGVGPVSVATVQELLPDAFVAAVVSDGVDVTTVAHLGRGPSALQRTAIEWHAPTCSTAGCPRTVSIQVDHRTPWATERITKTANLDPLCGHCHWLKTHCGYRLEPGTGRRRLLPPDHDPPDG